MTKPFFFLSLSSSLLSFVVSTQSFAADKIQPEDAIPDGYEVFDQTYKSKNTKLIILGKPSMTEPPRDVTQEEAEKNSYASYFKDFRKDCLLTTNRTTERLVKTTDTVTIEPGSEWTMNLTGSMRNRIFISFDITKDGKKQPNSSLNCQVKNVDDLNSIMKDLGLQPVKMNSKKEKKATPAATEEKRGVASDKK